MGQVGQPHLDLDPGSTPKSTHGDNLCFCLHPHFARRLGETLLGPSPGDTACPRWPVPAAPRCVSRATVAALRVHVIEFAGREGVRLQGPLLYF